MSTQVQDFYKATITRNWTATTGDFNVSVAPTVVPGIIVISPQSSSSREIVRYTAVGTNGYGPYVTVSNISDRGLSGTTAQSHIIGENIRMNITAEHWGEMQDDINNIIAGDFIPVGSDGQVVVSNGTNWVAGDIINKINSQFLEPEYLCSNNYSDVYFNTNTTLKIYSIIIKNDIDINSISFRTSTSSVGGTFKIGIYSSDGQTKILEHTTQTLTGGVTYKETMSTEIKLKSGKYYIAILPIGTFNTQISSLAHMNETFNGYFNQISGLPKQYGTITVTADTLPNNFNPITDITHTTILLPIIRINN